MEVGLPGLGGPVVHGAAVGDVDFDRHRVVGDRDPADQHRAVDPIPLEFRQHIPRLEARIGLITGPHRLADSAVAIDLGFRR